jgi:hypothetical protein
MTEYGKGLRTNGMDEARILWGLNSVLWLTTVFFIKKWFSDLEKKIDGKANKDTCEKTHEMLDKLAHTHAQSGTAGEVVPR